MKSPVIEKLEEALLSFVETAIDSYESYKTEKAVEVSKLIFDIEKYFDLSNEHYKEQEAKETIDKLNEFITRTQVY